MPQGLVEAFAATKLLREMESLFGGMLFTRSTSGLTPTTNGALLLEYADAILAEVALAQAEVAAGVGESPIVRVGASAIAVQLELLPVLGRFHGVYPEGQVRILEGRTASMLELLRHGQIDLAIGMLSAISIRDDMLRGISHRLLRQEEWVVVARRNHPLARKRRISLDDLGWCKWVLQPQESLIRTAFEQAFHLHGSLPPKPVVEALPFTTNLSVARSSDILTIIPRSAIISPENVGSLVVLRTDLKVDVPPLAIFYKAVTLKRTPVRAVFELLTSNARPVSQNKWKDTAAGRALMTLRGVESKIGKVNRI